ncbi:hypothetical protein LZZ85_07850 [Terrimonas sp. NA20]|uniref:Uncharacterized protein n=1 Tax=Terrimonas ginsenosidimutans TaxID=2908004 RepID=A0ABS9KPJ4_9BACT|nr:hypothetical protein [Terrimonas ginsenosidimutans]MCG2614190.1 hypothetical protein [Terrimonas ginsenosidimutans]
MVKIQTIEKLFYYINAISYLTFPAFYFFSKEKGRLPKILGIYGIIVCFFLCVFDYLLEEKSYNILLILQNLFTPFEYLVFTMIFFLTAGKRKRKFLIAISIIFIAFLITLFIVKPATIDSNLVLDTYGVGIETIIIFLYIFSFLYEQSKIDDSESIFSKYLFWISMGLLIYLGGSFFFNILVTEMSLAEFDNYYHYTYIAELIKNVLFLVALSKASDLSVKKKEAVTQIQMPYLDIDMN